MSPKRAHQKEHSVSGFKRNVRISEAAEDQEEENEKQNGAPQNLDDLLSEGKHQVEEEWEDDMCVAIRVDYLKDLETEYRPQDLKDFIMSHLNQDTLEYHDVAKLILSGAEINKYLDLN